jgi:hypothetical protein
LQWLQNPSQANSVYLNNVRYETRRSFRDKGKEYLKIIINFEANSKNGDIRDIYRSINELKRGCQPRTNLVKGENDNLVAVSPQYFEQMEEILSAIECSWH